MTSDHLLAVRTWNTTSIPATTALVTGISYALACTGVFDVHRRCTMYHCCLDETELRRREEGMMMPAVYAVLQWLKQYCHVNSKVKECKHLHQAI